MKGAYTFLTLCLSCIILISCSSTIRPKPIESNVPSFDGTNQNSGLLGFDNYGYVIISQRAYDQYNLLIDKYGHTFIPPLTLSYGAESWTNGTYRLTPEAAFNYAKMKHMFKEGIKGK